MKVLFDGGVEVKYGFMYLQPQWEDVDILRARGGQSNGLCGAAYPGVLVAATGLDTGTVPLRVESHPLAPPVDDAWQDVVEVSLTTPSSNYILIAFDWVADISMPPPATYRARWSATGMDEAAGSGAQRPGEHVYDRYLLQLWPEPASPDVIVRQGSQQAASWHALAAQAPPPPASPAELTELVLETERRRDAPWESARAEQQARVDLSLRDRNRRETAPEGPEAPPKTPDREGPLRPTVATYLQAMVDLHTVVALHGFADERTPHPPSKYGELIAPGVVHVDYGDADRVFRVTVEEVPRRHLDVPSTVVLVDDVEVRLADVVVDTHVGVRLEGVGAAAEATAADHRRRILEWAAQRSGPERHDPPPWPAERLRHTVKVYVTDDVGTAYDFATGESGGQDSPWVDLRRYLPAPPPHARVLQLRLVVAGKDDARVELPLARG